MTTQISLGAIQYYWPKQTVEQFYREVADSPVQRVYLGENVCSKRKELSLSDWLAIGNELAQAGKDVRLSTLALIEARQELDMITPYLEQQDFVLEANDIAVVQLCKERQLPFVAGNALNIYNTTALARMVDAGMISWVMPVELSREWLKGVLDESTERGFRDKFDVEVLGYGYLPLAYSARCFTARSLDRPKDQCKKCCLDYPDGRLVKNLEQQPMFVLNGIQTQSGYCYDLSNDTASMRDLVDYFRISANSEQIRPVIANIEQQLAQPNPQQIKDCRCNGYWWAMAGKESVTISDQ
ncbi:U32 family peptidase [Neiella marina]|uniref:U32 family peptidase n=1 Tax=Neiella holothuriorum TaxID=2870530 RepID=A0ABS7EEB9_9GAMM|nr:U32 family peptidase [Neiella holothuriorum]MBW8190663.1 U32 family peptidase [Neiella holothuriorum]